MDPIQLEHLLNCHPVLKTDIVKGENTNLFSEDGKRIIDFEAGMWCTALGHSNPRINGVITKQINRIMNVHYKLTNETAEKLAVNLLQLLHFEGGKGVFLSSGSEAVALSMRIASLISSGSKMFTFSTSYLSAFSHTSIPRNPELWVEIDFLQCSNCSHKVCTSKCNQLKNINFNDISTFILESVSCGRVLFAPDKLVKYLANEVKKHGGMIIANEVTTGLGRTGKWFAYQHYDVQPDIVVLGKSLGNGYPISAVIMRKEVAARIEEKNFIYVQSHQNDPLGCTVANEVISIMREEDMINRSKNIGEFFIHHLREIQRSNPIIKEVRGKGLMIAIEFNKDHTVEIIEEKMLEKGYFIDTTPSYNVLRFFPALTISKNDILKLCEDLAQVMLLLK